MTTHLDPTAVLSQEFDDETDVDIVDVVPKTPNVFILHHSDCDGYAAGAIALATTHDKSKKFLTIPVNYGYPFPDIPLTSIDEVYILDFSYPRDVLDEVYKKVSKLLVLDHHHTAELELKDTPYSIFDSSKSGVLLAWEYFAPGYPASEAIELLDAYDLWRKDDPVHPWEKVVKFHLACETQLKNLSFWTGLVNGYFIDPALWKLGEELYQQFQDSVDEVKQSPLTEVRVINNKRIGFFFAEEQISLLCDALYSDKDLALDAVISGKNPVDDKWTFSIRAPSHTDFHVHEIACQFGGGGHKKAAGFKMKTEAKADEIVEMLTTKLQTMKF